MNKKLHLLTERLGAHRGRTGEAVKETNPITSTMLATQSNLMKLRQVVTEIGNLLPNSQRQHRTCYALCHILYPVSAAHTSIFRMDSNSTSYWHRHTVGR